MSRTVLCFGEALIDFLNTGVQKDDILSLNQFTQFPGGAPANAAVAVAKLGGRARFAGQVGNDQFGHFLKNALSGYGVDTQFTLTHPSAKTALAFVFLDESGDRSFAFHRDNTADMVFEISQFDDSWFADQPIFHFCSNTLTEQAIAIVTRHIIEQAKKQQCLISFDVNLRHNLWPTGLADKALVNQLVLQCDLIKYSREEIEYLGGSDPEGYMKHCFSNGVKAILITDGDKAIQVCTPCSRVLIAPPAVRALDTTGGGDAFVGAVLFGLSQAEENFFENEERLFKLVEFASCCGAIAVSRPGAFPAFPALEEVMEQYLELY